jgi:hypothetical protein
MRNRGYHGNKPCPGCQRDVWRRSIDSVCEQCLNNINAGKKALADIAKGETKAMRLRKPRWPAAWSMPEGFNFDRPAYADRTMSPPTVSFHKGEFSQDWLNDEINQFLTALEIHPDTPMKPGFDCWCDDGFNGRSENFTLKSEHGLAWLRFYDAISRYMKFLQERAKEEGGNLLFRLVKEEVGFQPITKKEPEHEQ